MEELKELGVPMGHVLSQGKGARLVHTGSVMPPLVVGLESNVTSSDWQQTARCCGRQNGNKHKVVLSDSVL